MYQKLAKSLIPKVWLQYLVAFLEAPAKTPPCSNREPEVCLLTSVRRPPQSVGGMLWMHVAAGV
jgi:hypothetical protein